MQAKLVLRVLAACAVVGLAACGANQAVANAPAASPERAVATWTWDAPGGRERMVMMRNDSAEPVRITSIRLSECRNIQQSCLGAIPIDVVLQPGEAREVLRIRPARAEEAFSYRYTFNWTSVR